MTAGSGRLGVIADDYTGAIDVADALRDAGLSTVLLFGIDDLPAITPAADAIVIALKIRSVPASAATTAALAALDYLHSQQTDQTYFKYCSTFDSTPQGNIGPVLDALAERLAVDKVITTPSSPLHGRTVQHGLLRVHGVLLEHSHMAHHPLNPMTDSLVPRLLSAQTHRAVASLDLATVRTGSEAVRDVLNRTEGSAYLVADAVEQEDLDRLAKALTGSRLVGGAAGLALALARARGTAHESDPVTSAGLPRRSVVLAGSCSDSTLEQIRLFQHAGHPSYRLTGENSSVDALVRNALEWFDALPSEATPIFTSSVPADALSEVAADGSNAALLYEAAFGEIAVGLRDRGVGRFVVAGGETSGAIVQALGVRGGVVGARVDPGVAWLGSLEGPPLALLLKSGNFGQPDLFLRAIGEAAGTPSV